VASSSCAYRCVNEYPIQWAIFIFYTIIESFGDRQFCHLRRAGLHAADKWFRPVDEQLLRMWGVHTDHFHSFGLVIVIEFIITHLNTPAVVDWGRKDIWVENVVIECHLQDLHKTGQMQKDICLPSEMSRLG